MIPVMTHPVMSVISLPNPWWEGEPRPVKMASYLRALPGLREQFKDVPEDYWTRGEEPDGSRYPTATIACPCGGRPALRVGESRQCACGRIFLFLDPHVLVGNSPDARP